MATPRSVATTSEIRCGRCDLAGRPLGALCGSRHGFIGGKWQRFSHQSIGARAEQVRTLADEMANEKLQRTLLDIADEYDKPAEFTEAQEHRSAASQRHAAD
jgi:hypothetical protein